jgi:ParB-like chromosome segregation protein Spo0J
VASRKDEGKTIRTIHGEDVPESAPQHIAAHFRPFAMRTDPLFRDPKNARKHGEDDLPATAKSLEKFGERKPIEFDPKSRTIVAGNGRHEAAEKLLKWEWIAAVPVDLDAAALKAYALADNRTAEKSRWDIDALAAALEEIRADVDEYDLDLDIGELGFDKDDLAEIEEVHKVLNGDTPAKNEKKDVAAKTSFEVRIKCRSEKHQVQILEAIESQDAGKLAKAFKGVTVDEVTSASS